MICKYLTKDLITPTMIVRHFLIFLHHPRILPECCIDRASGQDIPRSAMCELAAVHLPNAAKIVRLVRVESAEILNYAVNEQEAVFLHEKIPVLVRPNFLHVVNHGKKFESVQGPAIFGAVAIVHEAIYAALDVLSVYLDFTQNLILTEKG